MENDNILEAMNESNGPVLLSEIFRRGIDVYKGSWKMFVTLAFYSALISLFPIVSMIILTDLIPDLNMPLMSFFSSIYTLATFYIISRLSVSIIIGADSFLKEEAITASNAFELAGDKTWRYIGYSILLGLMVAVPIILIVLINLIFMLSTESFVPNIVITAVGAIIVAILYTFFYFALIFAVLYPQQSNPFSASFRLVKGSYLKVLVIMLIPILVSVPLVVVELLIDTNQLNTWVQIGIAIVQIIPTTVISPLSIVFGVELMQRCLKRKEY